MSMEGEEASLEERLARLEEVGLIDSEIILPWAV